MKGRTFIKVLYLLLLFALVSCQERGERPPQAASPQVGTLSYDSKPLPPFKPEPLAWTAPVWQGYSLTLRTLGYRTGAELTGAQGEATLYLPVNPGLEPEALELKLAFSPGLPQGYLEILSQGQPVFQAALPAASLLIPLKGVKVERGLLTLTLRTQFPAKDLCAAQELFRVHVLPESRLLLAGRPTPPETLASFFPPHVERVVVHLPDPPSPEAAQAVLWLAGFLARTYPGRVPELRLEALPKAPLEPHPFVRHVVWQEGEGARLEGFALHLGSLREAARLFLAEPGLLQAPFPGEATEALSLKAPEELGPRVSLAELGYGPQRVEGFGVLTASYAFALADLGPKRHPVGLRLRAVHSPALSERGYVELLLNGVAFYSEPLEGTLLDLYAPVPARLLERNNTLEVRFRYAPAEGQCTYGALPFTATLDPASYLVLEGGEALSGLDAFPQALLPRFWVYLEPLDSFKLGLAARLVQALQETTKTPLLPEISPTPDRAPLLAVGGPGLPQALGAPLRTPGFRLVDSRGTPWLVVQPEGPYAALQAFSQKKGPLLLLSHTGTTGEILAPFLEEALKEGWFALHGEIALRGPSGPLVTFSLSKSALRVQPLPETPASFLARYRKEVYLVLTALALLSLVALYPKVVRRGKA